VDTETNGLNSFGTTSTQGHRIIGISIDDGTEAYYFPFRHQIGVNLPMECLEFFRTYLSDPNRVFGGFNYKFDQLMLYADGIPFAPNIEDAMLALHLVNENEENFKLKDTCDRYGIGKGSLEESILLEKCGHKKDRMGELDPTDVEPYACDDVRLTRMLLDLLKPALVHQNLYYIWKQVNYYSYITTQMERRGLCLDVDLIKTYQAEAKEHQEAALSKLYDMAGYKINPNSSKQVCAFLGVKSSARDILDTIIDAGGEAAEKAQAVIEARGWLSVDTRYYTPYMKMMDINNTLHCSLNLIGTISGRLSCSNPNLQAVARPTNVFKVKDVFIARAGYTLVSADYSQAEMRLACYYAHEDTMAELIRNGEDIHSTTAEALDIPRSAAKRINFGVIYGIGAEALHKQLRIDKKTAQQYLNKYHGMYPQFRVLLGQTERYADQYGVIELWTGRRRHFNVQHAYTHKAMSNLIQGGVAEIMRTAISRLYPAISNLHGYMLLQIHDQIICEIPDDKLDIALPTIKAVMEDFNFDPRMTVDISYGKRWGDMQNWSDEI